MTNISENEVLSLEARVTNLVFGDIFMSIIRNKEGMLVHRKRHSENRVSSPL